MTVTRRPGRLALAGGIALALGLAGIAAAWAHAPGSGPITTDVGIHYSHYTPARLTVPAGVAVTFVLRNDDPIDHEWIVGDAATHERHRTGTEPVHGSRPTEVSIPAGSSRSTTVTSTRSSPPSSFAAYRPPKPPPTIRTRCRPVVGVPGAAVVAASGVAVVVAIVTGV